MPVPSNLTALTAIDIGTILPATTTQQVDDSGTTYTVWYKYTAQVGDDDIGLWGFGGTVGTGYQPTTVVYLGPAAAPVLFMFGYFAFDCPIVVPVTPGTTYYFKFDPFGANTTPSNLSISVLRAPTVASIVGKILITEFGWDGDAAIVDPATGDMLGYRRLVGPSDHGDVLPSGIFAVDNGNTDEVDIYAADATPIASALSLTGAYVAVSSDRANTFIVGHATSGVTSAANARVTTVSDAGVPGPTTWILPSNSRQLDGMAPTRDLSILYYSRLASGEAIHAYDLINSVALPDFAAGRPGTVVTKDIFVLPDGSVIVAYDDEKIYHYDSAGATLNIFSTAVNLDRIFLDTDDLHLWIWTQTTSGFFSKILIADGSVVLGPVETAIFNQGQADAAVAMSMERFGVSNSCPLLVLPAASVPGGGIYFINPTKAEKHDSYYNDIEVKIPNPTVRLALFGE